MFAACIRNRLMLFKNLVFFIWFRCEWFEFGVNILNLVWVTWISVLSDLNSVWVIWIRCEWFEFGVSNLNSVWVIWIRCEWFKFGVHFYLKPKNYFQHHFFFVFRLLIFFKLPTIKFCFAFKLFICVSSIYNLLLLFNFSDYVSPWLLYSNRYIFISMNLTSNSIIKNITFIIKRW